MLDLIKARLSELAFLSVCHSATGDLSTPDETIHLVAALQSCRFRSVVGTYAGDEDGPTILKEFYKHIFHNPGNKADYRDSAEALQPASGYLGKRRNRVPLVRWIMFVYIDA